MEYSRRPTKSIPKENQLKPLNKIYQTYLVSTTESNKFYNLLSIILIVSRITYSNNGITKNKVACLWIYILSWVLKKCLQAFVDHHGYSMNSGHYTASTVVGKHFTVTIIKLLNVILRIPILHLLPTFGL